MPAKSKDLSAAYFLHGGTLACPPGLPKAAARLWAAIVASTPEGQFRVGDAPLLAAYCRISALSDEALGHLEAEGQVSEAGKVSPWVRVAADHAKSLASLGARLRLAPSSRIRAESVSLRQRAATAVWDADDDELLATPP